MSNWEEMVMSEDELISAYENNNPADDHAIGCVEMAKAQVQRTGELADAVIAVVAHLAQQKERERIIKYVEGNSDVIDWGDDIGEMRELKESIWQALRGKGE